MGPFGVDKNGTHIPLDGSPFWLEIIMINLKKKYAKFPTIMDYKDEIAAIKDLIDIGAINLLQDEGAVFVLQKIDESHQDNGVFEFKQTDGELFRQFVNLLREIKSLDPNGNVNIENMISTFLRPGFD